VTIRVATNERLLEIWLDGMASGIATEAMAHGATAYEAQRTAQATVAGISRDPIAREQLINEIHERLDGVDSGPKTVRVYG
jgi:hypothetical protein